MQWISPKDKLPPQGKKILYFKKGDIYVVQRFGKYWLPIPFHDSKYSFHDEPELWCDITPPNDLTGLMRIRVYGHFYNLDELEKIHPDSYEEVIDIYLSLWRMSKGVLNDGMD